MTVQRIKHFGCLLKNYVNKSEVIKQHKRTSSTFNINDIVKQNRANSQVGVRKVKPSKTASNAKTTKSCSEDSNTTNQARITDHVTSSKKSTKQKDTKVKTQKKLGDEPECFTVILDCPLYKESHLDTTKHTEFKDYIEELEIGYLPSVSSIIKKTESQKQQEVLRRWKEGKIRELGGEEEFNAYRKGNKCLNMNLY